MNHFFGRNPHAFPLSSPSMHPRSRRSLSRTVAYLGLQPSTSATHDAGTVALSIASFTAFIKASSVYCSANKWLSFFLGISLNHKHSKSSIVKRMLQIVYVSSGLAYVVSDNRYLFICSDVYRVLQTFKVCKHDNRNQMGLHGLWKDRILSKCRRRTQSRTAGVMAH